MIFQRLRCRGVVAVCSLNGVRMRFGWAVAGFATVDVILAGENEVRVTRFLELDHLVFVAVSAALRSRKRGGGCIELR